MKKITTNHFEVQVHGTRSSSNVKINSSNQFMSFAEAEAQLKTMLAYVQGQKKVAGK